MAKVVVGRDLVRVLGAKGNRQFSREEKDVIRLVSKDLSFRKDSYYFSAAYQERRWDGFYHLYSKHSHSFSTGFLSRTIGAWKKNGFEIVDERQIPKISIDPSRPTWGTLRDYQQDAIRAVLERKVHGLSLPRGIIHLPPRTGKTVIATGIIDQLREFPPAVFVVERIDLARQSVVVLKKMLGVEVGIVGDGETNIQPVTVMTIQSLHAAFDISYTKEDKYDEVEKKIQRKQDVVNLVSNCQVMIFDEAHHVSSNSYQKAARTSRNAFVVVGLSGTPWMDDGSDILLENAIGDVVFRRSYSWMVDQGWLVPLDIFFFHLPEVLTYSGSYQSVYKNAVVDNPVMTHLVVELARRLISLGMSVAIMTVQVQHARNLGKLIPGAVVITGRERGKYRHQVYRDLHRKKIKCVVSTVMSEGIDVPSLDAGINADGGQDSRRIFQRLRMMTPWDGKTRGIFVDFLHDEKHLSKHSRRRLEFYESEPSFRVTTKDVREKMFMKFSSMVPLR